MITTIAAQKTVTMTSDMQHAVHLLDGALEHLRTFFTRHAQLTTGADPGRVCAQLEQHMADCIDQAVAGISILQNVGISDADVPYVQEVRAGVESLSSVRALVGQVRTGTIPPAIPVQSVARTYAQMDHLRAAIGV